jgi:YjeF-related protein N-terminus
VVLTSFGSKRLDPRNHNPAPLVVLLAGNNRSGAFVLAAGRWLSLRGIRVLAVLPSNEDDDLEVPPLVPHLSQIIRTQLRLFKLSGGRKVPSTDLQRVIATCVSPPEVILEGIFGSRHSLDDLWDEEDKVSTTHLIQWANSARGRRVSVDKPALAREDLFSAEWVIQVGAVKEGVELPGTRTWLVDLGIARSVWKEVGVGGGDGQRGKRGDLGVLWDGKWVMEIEQSAI